MKITLDSPSKKEKPITQKTAGPQKTNAFPTPFQKFFTVLSLALSACRLSSVYRFFLRLKSRLREISLKI